MDIKSLFITALFATLISSKTNKIYQQDKETSGQPLDTLNGPNIIHKPIRTYFEYIIIRNAIYHRKNPYVPNPHDPYRPYNPNNFNVNSSEAPFFANFLILLILSIIYL